jgi:hypothetical protein
MLILGWLVRYNGKCAWRRQSFGQLFGHFDVTCWVGRCMFMRLSCGSTLAVMECWEVGWPMLRRRSQRMYRLQQHVTCYAPKFKKEPLVG